jgi:hypothetical protein
MKKIIIILSTILIFSSSFISAQNFSCAYGKTASCLDYNDKVVDSNSICFDQYVCGFNGGLICKSKYDDVINEYNDLLRKNNDLVDNYNDVLNKNKNLVSEFNYFLSDNEELQVKNQRLKNCLSYADSIEEAKACAF